MEDSPTRAMPLAPLRTHPVLVDIRSSPRSRALSEATSGPRDQDQQLDLDELSPTAKVALRRKGTPVHARRKPIAGSRPETLKVTRSPQNAELESVGALPSPPPTYVQQPDALPEKTDQGVSMMSDMGRIELGPEFMKGFRPHTHTWSGRRPKHATEAGFARSPDFAAMEAKWIAKNTAIGKMEVLLRRREAALVEQATALKQRELDVAKREARMAEKERDLEERDEAFSQRVTTVATAVGHCYDTLSTVTSSDLCWLDFLSPVPIVPREPSLDPPTPTSIQIPSSTKPTTPSSPMPLQEKSTNTPIRVFRLFGKRKENNLQVPS